MSRGTKISLAVAAVLVAALGLYYGVFRSGPESVDLDQASIDGKKVPGESAPRPMRIAAPKPDSEVGGILSESISQATAPRGSTEPQTMSTGRPRPQTDPLTVQGPPTSETTAFTPPPVTRGSGPRPSAVTTRVATYQVKSGDSMSSISLAWFGDATRWQSIANANPRIDPLKLQIGQTLKLPAKSTIAADTRISTTTPPARADNRTHIVRAGDNLSWIASRYYGDIGKWSVIYKANRPAIGSDPNTLKIGMRLLIPPAS